MNVLEDFIKVLAIVGSYTSILLDIVQCIYIHDVSGVPCTSVFFL
jgi:hypothetical protein